MKHHQIVWYPDIDDLKNQIARHPDIAGILLVNPDNPTWMVYSQDVIRQLVEIAAQNDLFIISDEIYSNLCYGGVTHKKLASVIGNVPGIAMRGISKVHGLTVHKAYGAFYMTILFDEGTLRKGQFLKPANPSAAAIIQPLLETASFDKCFVYNLLASRGICVVPLSSGFNSDLQGFRITLLEPDITRFKDMITLIGESVNEYLHSK